MDAQVDAPKMNLEDKMENMNLAGEALALNQASKIGKTSKKHGSTVDSPGPKKSRSRKRKFYKNQIRYMKKRDPTTLLETIYEEPKKNRFDEINYTGQRKKRALLFHHTKVSTIKKQQEKLQRYFGRTTSQRQSISKEEFEAKMKALDNCLPLV